MATEVIMPKLGLTMERGTVGAWLKAEGDPVARGEPLLEVVTDKVTMEVEAQAAGRLRRILVEAGIEIEVGTPIGIIADADEDLDAAAGNGPSAAAKPRPRVASPAPRVLHSGDEGPKHRASPKARRMAVEHGVDLAAVAASGPGGRVVSADVEAFLRGPGATPTTVSPAVRVRELTHLQQVAAERLTASFREAPHIDLEVGVSAVWLEQLRRGYAAEGRAITYNDLLLRAVAAALSEHPGVNARFVDSRVHEQARVDLGMAVDTPEGLLVPVLRDAAALSIDALAAEAHRLAQAARHGRLGPDDLAGGTFTVSNLGMLGVSRFTAIINPPQVAILAVGAVERVVVPLADDGVAVRPRLRLTLSADHRAVDGAAGARFLQRLREIIESPALLGG